MFQETSIPLLRILLVAGCTDLGNDRKSQRPVNRESGKLSSIVDINREAEKIPNIRSLIFSENGRILSEKYFQPYSVDSLDHVRSVTKSITSLLIGIAIDQGIIKSVEQPISDFLTDKYPSYKSKLEQITIHHLLTMTSGFQWDESSVTEFNQWVVSSDPIKYLLNRKLRNNPSEKWEYNSAGSHLLSVILAEASGMSTAAFASKYFFETLGIKNIAWDRIGKYHNGGAGLQLRPIDMHTIGLMMNNLGSFNGKQVVPADWINEVTKPHKKVNGYTSYGYLWWIENDPEGRVAFAVGHAGQFIVTIPEIKAVITASCNWRSTGGKSAVQQSKVAELIKFEIYPYLKKLAKK